MKDFERELLGRWDNFEDYIDSEDPAMVRAWAEADAAVQAMPAMAAMFAGGPQAFWRRACATVNAENPVRLAGWQIAAAGNWPFRYLLAMAPMPMRQARQAGGLLSHLHFQFASREETLLQGGKLCQPGWYATFCDAEGTRLERCNIVRALHRLPAWADLPEDLK